MDNLFTDLQDGTKLLTLLNIFTGVKLVCGKIIFCNSFVSISCSSFSSSSAAREGEDDSAQEAEH